MINFPGKNREKIISGTLKEGITKSYEEFSLEIEKKKNIIKNNNPHMSEKIAYDHTIATIRNALRDNLEDNLEEIRVNQVEKNPANPDNLFASTLLNSIREELSDELGRTFEENFEVKFYSSVDHDIDYALGVDCWVELVKKENNKSESVIESYFIDLTSNNQKGGLSGQTLANIIFFYDAKNINSETGRNNVNMELIFSDEFDELVEMISDEFKNAIKYS